jgi:hypothetical protein
MEKKNKTNKLKQNVVMRSFSMETVLDFGKHKGKTIKQLFDEDEELYVMWMFENIDGKWSFEIERELEWRQAESDQIGGDFIWGIDINL